MFRKANRKSIVAGRVVLAVALSSTALFGQPAASPAPGLEFPVVMRQNVVAGATPIGTKVQARLAVATLVNGVVVPQDAVLSGEVTESAAKSATDPSRLAVRMDNAKWKNGSAAIKVYLTAWYYPLASLTNQDSSDDPMDSKYNPRRHRGNYTDPTLPPTQPIPGRDPANDPAPPAPLPEPGISKHRVLMKNVESTRKPDGVVTLTSKRSNIKLDKQTTYVLAAGELAMGPS
jgi:hypothetical protein